MDDKEKKAKRNRVKEVKRVNTHGSTASMAKLNVQLGQLESHYNRYV